MLLLEKKDVPTVSRHRAGYVSHGRWKGRRRSSGRGEEKGCSSEYLCLVHAASSAVKQSRDAFLGSQELLPEAIVFTICSCLFFIINSDVGKRWTNPS